MTGPTKRNLEKRLEDLGGDVGDEEWREHLNLGTDATPTDAWVKFIRGDDEADAEAWRAFMDDVHRGPSGGGCRR